MTPRPGFVVGCLTLLTAGTASAQAHAGEAHTLDADGAAGVVSDAPSASQTAKATVPPPETRRWYGWQTLTVDGAALVLIVTGVAAYNGTDVGWGVATVGLTMYTFGGPIVHWAHGNVGKGFASLGLKLGLPVALGAAGAWACETYCISGNGYEGLVGLVIGAPIGMVAAEIIDVGLLAYEPVAVDRGASRAAKPAPSLMPEIAFTPDRMTWVGLRGVF